MILRYYVALRENGDHLKPLSALSTTTTSSSFLAIASKSGGTIYSTDNAGIRGLSRVIQGNIRASQVNQLEGTLSGRE